ncbi:MAG: LysM peptidoglycan-binding domain-containing protein [Clostridiales bacterium]|nr:LysM peptidoglycan-binding domain-containing protein [Clostridiales bacterium]
MGELYHPYSKLPKNIRQIGERDQVLKLYVEDYVSTYLKRLYPAGGRGLRAGLLLGGSHVEDGMPCLFVDGALEMETVHVSGEQVELSDEDLKGAYRMMEQMFPKREVLGWFLCGAPGCTLSPLNYWKQHGTYFPGKNQLMYLNGGLEGEEALYVAAEGGFYRLRGYCIYYERNQMMQDYMVSRKDARRTESGTRDGVIRDFRQRMEENQAQAGKRRTAVGSLGTACALLSVVVLAGGVTMFNNYQKMKAMESVLASALPEEISAQWADPSGRGEDEDELVVEYVPGEVYPTEAALVIEGSPATEGQETETAEQVFEEESASAEGTGEAETSATVSSVDQNIQKELPVAGPVVDIPADAILYTVQTGETLYGICVQQYGSLAHADEICAWNDLGDGSHIVAGQKLYIPAN